MAMITSQVAWFGVKYKGTQWRGASRSPLGFSEYLSQSNDNTKNISNKMKFKFIDDLTVLEKINILSIGISSYNFKSHVASDIPANGYYIDNLNLKTQDHVNKMTSWTGQLILLSWLRGQIQE